MIVKNEMEYTTAQMYFGCVIEVLLDSLSSIPVVLRNLSLLHEMASLLKWVWISTTGNCELKLPFMYLQSVDCFHFVSFKMTDTVSPSMSSRDNLLKSPFLQPARPEVCEAYFPWGGRNGYGSLSLMSFSRTFSFISQVPDSLAVQPQTGVSLSFPPPCFLAKTDSSAAASLLNSKLLFTPQRLAFLLLSVAMVVVKIQRHLCLPWSLWVWFFLGGLLDFYYFLGLVCFGFCFGGFLLLFWVGF